MEWSGFGNDKASVGYIASREIFNNHPSSGFSLIGNALSCPTENSKKRRKRQIGLNRGNTLVLPIGIGGGTGGIQQSLMARCLSGPRGAVIHNTQISFVATLLTRMQSCPSEENHAIIDIGRFIPFGTIDNPQCYITGKPLRVGQPMELSEFTFTQHCCYDSAG